MLTLILTLTVIFPLIVKVYCDRYFLTFLVNGKTTHFMRLESCIDKQGDHERRFITQRDGRSNYRRRFRFTELFLFSFPLFSHFIYCTGGLQRRVSDTIRHDLNGLK